MVTYVYIMVSQHMYIKLATYEQMDLFDSYVFFVFMENQHQCTTCFYENHRRVFGIYGKCEIY